MQPEQLQPLIDEAKKTGKNPEDIIVKQGLLSAKDLASAKGELYGLPFANLEEMQVPFEVLNTIPMAVAQNYSLVLFEKKGKDAKVALVDPSDFRAIEAIDFWAKSEGQAGKHRNQMYYNLNSGK